MTAQQSAVYTQQFSEFDRAEALYNDRQFLAAQLLFDKLIQNTNDTELRADCVFYSASCALHLNQSNAAELVHDFIASYPTSTKLNQLYSEVATYYFEQGDYSHALEYFDKVDESALTYDELDAFNFQKGYAYFNAKKQKKPVRILIG